MAVRHDPERDAGEQEEPTGGFKWWRLIIILLIIALICAGLWFFSRDATSPTSPPRPTSTTVTPPAFEDIVLEVDPVKYQETCLAAGGTEAECQATLGDLEAK